MAMALQSVIAKLGYLLTGEYNLLKRVKGDIMFLKSELESMKAAFEEMLTNTPPEQLDSQDKIWARDVRELSHDIEDSIDTYTFMLCSKGTESAKLLGIKDFIDKSVGLLDQANTSATKIKNISSRVTETRGRHHRYAYVNPEIDNLFRITVDLYPHLPNLYTRTKDLVGIDERTDELEKTAVPMQKYGKVVSIVGCGGIGKTTLAKAVYEKIRARFDSYAFVSVFRTPNLGKLFRGLLYDLGCKKINEEICNQEQLRNILRQFLQDKRYCIVIDDIWNISAWDLIKCALPDNDVGYMVITTTRSPHIAEIVGGAYILKPLSLNNSRKLLCRRIFGNEKQDNTEDTDKCPGHELAEISDIILKKCGGLPLAITVMAGLLASNARNNMKNVYNFITSLENSSDVVDMSMTPTRNFIISLENSSISWGWDRCLASKLAVILTSKQAFIVSTSDVGLMPVLKSFHVLHVLDLKDYDLKQGYSPGDLGKPFHLRYLELHVTHIARLPKEILTSLKELSTLRIDYSTMGIIEELGHLTELRMLNIVPFGKWNSKLMENLSKLQKIQILGAEVNISEGGLEVKAALRPTSSLQKVRSVRVCLDGRSVSIGWGWDRCLADKLPARYASKQAIIVFTSDVGLMPVLKNFEVLCVLDLEDYDLSQGYSPNDLGKPFHLRYLELHGTHIVRLPEEIENIQPLQTLDVRHTNISRLPSTVVQLGHLMCLYTNKSTRVPNGIGKLTSLKELSTLRIDDSTMGIIEELGQLTELRVLNIVLFGKWNSKLLENLSKLQKIQILGAEVNISEGDLEEVKAALRHAIEVHPNRRTLRFFIGNKRDSKNRVKYVHQKHEYRYKIDGVVAEPETATIFPCLFTQYMKVADLIGNEETVNELMKILTEGTEMPQAHGKIVSIVGHGGLGKTTLAHAIYKKLRAQFDCWAFVSISRNPDMKKLFKCMLYQLGKKNNANIHEGILDERQLIYELNEFLQKRRYFIVIDDIQDILVWDMIKCALPTNDGGFMIITTTSILDVAEQVGATYMMRPLCLQNSRMLLHRKTFGIEDKDEYADEELAEISEKILQKCGGVPLAIIMLSGLLVSKGDNKMEWYKVYSSIDTIVKNSLDVESMKKILSLNYGDLPSHLRTCLLYLSVFPEGHDIDKDRLIRLWIAEGLIQCKKQEESPFEIGESYFYELMNRSMIQPVYKRWYYDMTECCYVHDMVLDLIRCLSGKEKLVCIWEHRMHDTFHSKEVQWLSLQNSMVDHHPTLGAMNMQKVRSVVVFPSADKLLPALTCFKVLRVLDLQSCCLSQGCSLKYLGNLFHLRYLGLRGTGIANLCEEIGKLQFLQTLDVTCNEISSLPFTVAELKHLMCLRIDSRTGAPNGIGSFTSLEELSTLRIQDSTDIIEKLGNQTELRVLGIDCRTGWNVNRVEKSLVDSLHKLKKIRTLSISVVGECNLDSWVAPPRLRRLELTGCWPSPVPALLNNPSLLVELFFLSMEVRNLKQEDLESLGRLPALSYLDIEVGNLKLGTVQTFVISAGSFLCLVHCTLRGYIGPVAFQRGAMPEVARLHLAFPVREVREGAGINGGGFDDLGFGNLMRLKDVSFLLRPGGASKGEVQEAVATLRQAIESHPNHPTLEIL